MSLAALTGCGGGSSNGGGASGGDGGATRTQRGCYAFDIGAAGGIPTLATSGDPNLDRALAGEMSGQTRFWGLPVPFYLVDDSSTGANAFYDPQHDLVALGITMLQSRLEGYGGAAVQGVLAHEMGHKVQYTLYPQLFGTWARNTELEADCYSGFYMAYQGLDWNAANGYLRSTYSVGDYNFTNPQHHGTPDERVAAALLGFNTAVYFYQRGYTPSYADLHQVFYGSVSRHVTRETTDPRWLAPTRGVNLGRVEETSRWLDTHHSAPLKNPIPIGENPM